MIDFTKPTRLKEVAYYDMERLTGSWSAYPYTGPLFKGGPGVPIHASDGVEDNAYARGMEVYRAIVPKPGMPRRLDHLNPQTMEDEVRLSHPSYRGAASGPPLTFLSSRELREQLQREWDRVPPSGNRNIPRPVRDGSFSPLGPGL